jgi:hypothetical protein
MKERAVLGHDNLEKQSSCRELFQIPFSVGNLAQVVFESFRMV